MNIPTKIIWCSFLTTIAIVIMSPDTAIWLIHNIVTLLHTLFELFESMLDEIIEQLFHTDRHTTQVIVFYLMWAMILYPVYRLSIYWKKRIAELKQTISYWWTDKKNQAKTQWQQQLLVNKFKYVCGCFLGVVGFSYLLLF